MIPKSKNEMSPGGHHRKASSIIDMMPDFEGQILQCQTYLTKLKSNNEKILALKEKHNKTVATNKEKGFE